MAFSRFFHFPIAPGERAALVKDRSADHADVARVAIFFLKMLAQAVFVLRPGELIEIEIFDEELDVLVEVFT